MEFKINGVDFKSRVEKKKKSVQNRREFKITEG